MILLQKFIIEHEDWREILSTEPYNLKITENDTYIMLKYNQLTSDFTNAMVREARGIIFRKDNFDCVCFPFAKFGNYGEAYCPDINWETASVQEKVDGSLIKLWYDNNTWNISTNGVIDAYESSVNDYMSFGDLFEHAINETHKFTDIHDFYKILDTNFVYMFELVSPYNRVVIPYTSTKLYFIGIRNQQTYKESFPDNFIEITNYFDIPKRYNLHSLDDVIKASESLPWDNEGYVVCDANFNRVKIKSPAYVMAHYARNNNVMTTERLVDVILRGEEEEFLIYAEDYKDRLLYIKSKMNEYAHKAVEQMKVVFGATREYPTRGSYAATVLQCDAYMRDFLFHCYDDRIFWDYAQNWSARDWAKIIKEADNGLH